MAALSRVTLASAGLSCLCSCLQACPDRFCVLGANCPCPLYPFAAARCCSDRPTVLYSDVCIYNAISRTHVAYSRTRAGRYQHVEWLKSCMTAANSIDSHHGGKSPYVYKQLLCYCKDDRARCTLYTGHIGALNIFGSLSTPMTILSPNCFMGFCFVSPMNVRTKFEVVASPVTYGGLRFPAVVCGFQADPLYLMFTFPIPKKFYRPSIQTIPLCALVSLQFSIEVFGGVANLQSGGSNRFKL